MFSHVIQKIFQSTFFILMVREGKSNEFKVRRKVVLEALLWLTGVNDKRLPNIYFI